MVVTRRASADDLPAVAAVFCEAFAESVRHAGAGANAVTALTDLFGLVLVAEPGAVLVAESGGEVAGYILAPRSVKQLRRRILLQGRWLRVAWRLITGRYGIGLRTVRALLSDKLSFQRGMRLHAAHQARILSIGVSPRAQGQGLGRALVEAGLAYLRAAGASGVRLEVRPENASARRLYESFGFREQGSYHDSQGKWLVMTLERLENTGADA